MYTTEQTHDDDGLVSSPAVCKFLGCGPTHLNKLCRSGELTPIRIGKRMTRYHKSELRELADRLLREARDRAAAEVDAPMEPHIAEMVKKRGEQRVAVAHKAAA
ncbi:MAG: helix-turn-helix domain-containing protein [Bryocella sp.]